MDKTLPATPPPAIPTPANLPGDPAAGEAFSGDWRSRLQPEAREQITNRIMYSFRRHFPIFVHEGLDELKKRAVQFEEKMYTVAIHQSDYLRGISMKLKSMETKTQGSVTINLLNQAVGNQIPSGSVFMDSTAQKEYAGPDDWQEEIYQKVKSMKELYLPEISELHQRITLKIEQIEAHRPPAPQFDKLKKVEQMLRRTMMFLQIRKDSIDPKMKGRLHIYEKQIMDLVASNRNKKAALSQQQGEEKFQHPSGNTHFMPLQQPSEVPNLQHHDNHVPQFQHLNLQAHSFGFTCSVLTPSGGDFHQLEHDNDYMGGDITQHSKKQRIRKEKKEKVNRKIQKPKSRLPSTLHPNQKDSIQQSIPSLLQQLVNAIDEQQQQGPPSLPAPISRSPVLRSPQLRDQRAELQSRLQFSENVVHDLCRCIPLLETRLEIEKSSVAKMKSAIEAMEIQEASAREEQNVSTAIMQRELSNLAKAASRLRG